MIAFRLKNIMLWFNVLWDHNSSLYSVKISLYRLPALDSYCPRTYIRCQDIISTYWMKPVCEGRIGKCDKHLSDFFLWPPDSYCDYRIFWKGFSAGRCPWKRELWKDRIPREFWDLELDLSILITESWDSRLCFMYVPIYSIHAMYYKQKLRW